MQNTSAFRYFPSILNHNTISMNSASEERSDLILDDVIPINKLENEYIRYRNTYNFKSKPKLTSMILKSYTTGQDKWKQLLLSKYKEYVTDTSLAAVPQSKEKLIIVSNGSKKKMTSSGAWVIANEKGIPFVEGINPDFGTIIEMHSHRSEKCGVL